MPKNTDVRIGAPDQKVTGAIKHAPLGTAVPTLADITKAAVALNEAFGGDEYVSQDGLTLAPSMSTTEIKDWSGSTVRKVLESFDGTLSWTMISTNEGALGIAFGSSHVTTVAATAAHGAQVQAALGAYLPEEQAWVFLMKDGDARIVIAVPDGQITEVGEVTFASNAAVGWQVTLSCYPDTDGNCIYIMTDDGQVTTA
jgi:hypothetical protein